MAVAKIKLINIVGLTEQLDNVINVLGKSHVFHPDEVSEFYSDTKQFEHIPAKNNYADQLNDFKSALESAKFPLKYINVDDFNPDDLTLKKDIDSITAEIKDLLLNVEKAQSKVDECKRKLVHSEHFSGLDMKVEELLSCKYVKSHFGRLPKESYQKLKNYEENPFVNFFICSEEEKHFWGVYIVPIDQELEINRIFSSLYFEPSDMNDLDDTPEALHHRLMTKLPKYENRLKEEEYKLDKYKQDNIEKVLKYYSKLSELNLYSSIRSKALQYKGNTFCIVGWVPKENIDSLREQLGAIDSVETEVSSGKNELKHSPPVKLKNNFFTRPFEFYTEMFGSPRYNEIDPTPFVALSYIVLFGIMFGDVGHGIVLSIAGFLMWKLKNMGIGKILIPCGISSACFGLLFGSVFGFEHLLDPMYHNLFGLEEKPIEVMAPEATNTIIFASVGIGIALLCTAIILGIYSQLKQKNIGEAIFGTNGLCGLVFYASLVAGIVCQMLLGIPIMTLPYILGLIVLPLLLLYLREIFIKLINKEKHWKPEKWGGFLVDNFFELFEVLLSYVTNTMSFLRVGAFVLVHAGMMQVVFVLGEMVGGAGEWIIIVLGNGFVLALEALLVAIQVLRLEYYEMFSRFYTGDGRAYEPVKLQNTKH